MSKLNVNYFKKTDSMRAIGLAMSIVGIVFLWLGWNLYYILFLISLICLPAGLAMFFVGSARRSTDEDIETDIKNRTYGIVKDLSDDKHMVRKMLRNLPPVVIEGYEFSEGLMFTKAKNSQIRSSEYTATAVHILSDMLHVDRRTVCLTTEENREGSYDIPYESVKNVYISREKKTVSFGKNTYNVHDTRFCVDYGEGLTLSVPIHDDMDADALVEKIKNQMAIQ